MSEDEMVGWHHQLDGHELGRIPGDGEGQRNLAAFPGVTKSQTKQGTELEQRCHRTKKCAALPLSRDAFLGLR